MKTHGKLHAGSREATGALGSKKARRCRGGVSSWRGIAKYRESIGKPIGFGGPGGAELGSEAKRMQESSRVRKAEVRKTCEKPSVFKDFQKPSAWKDLLQQSPVLRKAVKTHGFLMIFQKMALREIGS